MTKLRGFEIVKEEHRVHFTDVKAEGKTVRVYADVQLPTRADTRSAGYDFYMPCDAKLLPAQKMVIASDVKAYMQPDEVLMMYPRSSLGIKQGLMLSNTVGVIDSSYYNNIGNDGNIGFALLNTSGVTIEIKRGERIVQGIFQKYLITDDDKPISAERIGGTGSIGA